MAVSFEIRQAEIYMVVRNYKGIIVLYEKVTEKLLLISDEYKNKLNRE